MEIIIALIVGGLIGWIAARIAGRREGIIASIVIGIVGSIIGDVLSTAISGSNHAYLAFTWSGILWSFIGAIILVLILNAVQHRTHHTHA